MGAIVSPLPYLYIGITKIINIMNKNERFVITINRELGSGGRTVGRILAEKLGVPYYDKALAKPLEEKFDMTLDQIEKLKGNNRSWWEEIKRVLILGESAANSSEHYDEENKKYVTSEAVLKAEKEILHSIAMAKQGLSEKEAKKVIKEVDETREEYMKNNAHTSRYDTRNYDLVISMDGKTEEEAVNVILAYIG